MNKRDSVVEALERARVLISLLTVRQTILGGDKAIEASGLNPWCMNEGLATGDEKLRADFLDDAIQVQRGRGIEKEVLLSEIEEAAYLLRSAIQGTDSWTAAEAFDRAAVKLEARVRKIIHGGEILPGGVGYAEGWSV